ncbi:phage tail tip lysozyme [Luteococcus peritonei]|uniref:Phage tail tip lysozyme n=1 Tax=Luteococcus peritonei TaxID=88874 RepID=A0ABW4RY98_9ACTN
MNPQHRARLAATLTATALVGGLGTSLPAQAALPAGDGVTTTALGRTSPNKIAYDYFRAKGLTPAQSAGIVGNLMQESGSPINPRARQKGGPGMGIAQWSRGARWNQLTRYAAKTKRSPYALNTQLDFIWVELNGSEKRALGKLRASRSLPAATASFSRHYERCAPRWCHNTKRTANAQRVLSAYAR